MYVCQPCFFFVSCLSTQCIADTDCVNLHHGPGTLALVSVTCPAYLHVIVHVHVVGIIAYLQKSMMKTLKGVECANPMC